MVGRRIGGGTHEWPGEMATRPSCRRQVHCRHYADTSMTTQYDPGSGRDASTYVGRNRYSHTSSPRWARVTTESPVRSLMSVTTVSPTLYRSNAPLCTMHQVSSSPTEWETPRQGTYGEDFVFVASPIAFSDANNLQRRPTSYRATTRLPNGKAA